MRSCPAMEKSKNTLYMKVISKFAGKGSSMRKSKTWPNISVVESEPAVFFSKYFFKNITGCGHKIYKCWLKILRSIDFIISSK